MSAANEFQSFAQRWAERSGAQLQQDLWVLWETAQQRAGFFVEIGAADGVYLSNTLLLEREFEWTGIVVEPLPAWHGPLVNNRRCQIDTRCVTGRSGDQVALVTSDARPDMTASVAFAYDDMHAEMRRGFTHTLAVPSVSLNDLLAEHAAPPAIDYLSIDTEGSELEILESFDFERYSIRLLTVEHNFHTVKRRAIADLLAARGFRRHFEEVSQWDDWYVSDT